MIQARMTLPDGRTPGNMRKGSTIILRCIAEGCKIYPDPLNHIPDEWSAHVLRMGEADMPQLIAKDKQRELIAEIMQADEKDGLYPPAPKKRGRPRKTT